MHIVDSHTHASPEWFEPVETLLHAMQANRVAQALLVQYRGNYHNDYLFDCMHNHPGRFAICVAVDVSKADAPDALERLVRRGAGAVRFWLAPREAPPEAVWRKADELGLAISIIGTEAEFGSEEVRRLAAAHPNTRVVIEHFGRAGRDEQPPFDAFRKVLALSELPNTFMKLGGLGEICHRPEIHPPTRRFASVPPFARMAVEAFGPRRLMFASDFPPVTYREGYGNALRGLMEHLSWLDQADLEWIFGRTAQEVWRFSGTGAGQR